MLAYRSTVHESIQCTPNKLMYGWNVALPIDVIADPSPRASEIPQCPAVYVKWLHTSLENSFRHARESLKRAAFCQKKYYDLKAGKKWVPGRGLGVVMVPPCCPRKMWFWLD